MFAVFRQTRTPPCPRNPRLAGNPGHRFPRLVLVQPLSRSLSMLRFRLTKLIRQLYNRQILTKLPPLGWLAKARSNRVSPKSRKSRATIPDLEIERMRMSLAR